MTKLIATQSFLNNGVMVKRGDIIDVAASLAQEYITRKLAKEDRQEKQDQVTTELLLSDPPKVKQTRKKKTEE